MPQLEEVLYLSPHAWGKQMLVTGAEMFNMLTDKGQNFDVCTLFRRGKQLLDGRYLYSAENPELDAPPEGCELIAVKLEGEVYHYTHEGIGAGHEKVVLNGETATLTMLRNVDGLSFLQYQEMGQPIRRCLWNGPELAGTTLGKLGQDLAAILNNKSALPWVKHPDYEFHIGPCIVRMSSEAAVRWNHANLTEQDLADAMINRRHNGIPSHVNNRWISLKEMQREDDSQIQAMEGYEAYVNPLHAEAFTRSCVQWELVTMDWNSIIDEGTNLIYELNSDDQSVDFSPEL